MESFAKSKVDAGLLLDLLRDSLGEDFLLIDRVLFGVVGFF